jgi:hypothetical protein
MLPLAKQSESDLNGWKMTRADAPWALALASRRYPAFNIFQAQAWFDRFIDDDSMCFVRNDHAACVACIVTKFWQPTVRDAHVMFLLSEEGRVWDAVRALRRALEWARSRGAEHFEISSDTHADISRIAPRLGKTREVRAHILEIN